MTANSRRIRRLQRQRQYHLDKAASHALMAQNALELIRVHENLDRLEASTKVLRDNAALIRSDLEEIKRDITKKS